MEDRVSISKDEYEALLRTSIKYNFFKEFVLSYVSLSYDRRTLYLSGTTDIDKFYMTIEPENYYNLLTKLQEKENKENE
jgi:hypothetical protein